jgi:Tfp pilus assembly protein PilX
MLMNSFRQLCTRARRRLAGESGFTMVIALGVLLITSLLVTATFVALTSDAHQTQTDLDGKRAYYAAKAGVEQFLYNMNQNPNYWQTCTNDTVSTTAISGSTQSNPATYSYSPVLANGSSSCSSTNAIGTLIDSSTGTLTMKFTGTAGNPAVTRGLEVSFRKDSPLDYLWYTVYEALDSSINGYSNCGQFYRTNNRPSGCNISWANNDVVNGPMYTQDQYMIGGSVTFGRASSDNIESEASGSICTGGSCAGATIKGTQVPNAGAISPPSDNSSLLTDATNHGKVFNGTTNIALNGTTATVTTCTTSSSCSTTSVDITQYPIIYAANATSCTVGSYTPFDTTYSLNSSGNAYGCAGDVYVSGNYSSSLTIAAANDIVINGSLTTSLSGSAVAGLVANHFIRVYHPIANYNSSTGSCTNASGSLTSPTIDAALLGLQHSFIVDNYGCGATLGTLTVNGAIAQYFRGTVATSNSGTVQTGYVKAYSYDDRLHALSPPYLFDIATAGWHISRENLCQPNGGAATAC